LKLFDHHKRRCGPYPFNRPSGTANTDHRASLPSNELPGYSQSSLRDKKMPDDRPVNGCLERKQHRKRRPPWRSGPLPLTLPWQRTTIGGCEGSRCHPGDRRLARRPFIPTRRHTEIVGQTGLNSRRGKAELSYYRRPCVSPGCGNRRDNARLL
jgi:hypothetical protein